MAATGLLLASQHRFDINTTPTTVETLARLGAGLTDFDVSFNEEIDQTKYLDGDGWGTSTVTGAQLVVTFSGHRVYGDAAQDFVFGKVLGLGTERETTFTWTLPNGAKYSGKCTVAGIENSGSAGSKTEISIEVHFNGKPTFTAAPA